ncbi:hypothetical protein [Natronorubrum daqingense]|uniref:Lipase (Class 2) n=1 Tax=Natronorubrum daqingense TaxID=588898 RepID=A0A1N7FQL3_9EURY|nr:hypothetical protein [Natronorubrum daqingense]APX97331.1 hypothetical protein BB347_12300 [Natronorubrum daqingense]SIS02526.1 Lipase (class 2) [Natronorubrum daqingense]
MTDTNTQSRRRLLELAGVTASVGGLAALAGCASDTSDDAEGDDGDDSSSDDGTGDGDGKNDDTEESKSDGEDEKSKSDGPDRPVLFVHGGMGSATQFESQAMRFTSNGYPQEYLAAYEYDSLAFEEIQEDVIAGVHERVDDLLAETGADGVDLLGHSLGTQVLQGYLADPDRAESAANYVNIDGREADSPPGGVPTLALWALGNEDAEIGGAANEFFEQGHVEVATSEEAFGAIYEFLTDDAPKTTQIEPEPADEVTLSGRALVFPDNVGVEGATLEVYAINPKTGSREETVATQTLKDDGRWGPLEVDGTDHHEFVVRECNGVSNHVYRQPELRSNGFVRLLVGEPGGLTDELVDRGPDHTALVINRDKEWWADQGDASDELLINETSVLTEATAPLEDGIVTPMVFDAGEDGETDVTQPVPAFQALPFLTGINTHIPAADPPDDVVSITGVSRDRGGLERTVKVPNRPSDDHRMTVHLPDHEQTR